MASVGIISDSIHGLSPELVAKYNIHVAPMGVNVNGKGYRDLVDISSAQFYQLLKEMKQPGTTNGASPGDFFKIYESIFNSTDKILYIGVSKVLTATFGNAEMAKKMFLAKHPKAQIELVDSKNCMGCLGFLLLEAARASEKGMSLPEVVKVVENLVPRVKYVSVLDTLRFLLRIGRIPPSAASEEKLNYRPMIGMTNNSGLMENFPSVPSEQALDKLLDLAQKCVEPNKPVHAIVHYSEYVQEANKLKEMVVSRFNPVELYMTEYTPASLCSTGLMSGLAIYSE
jgi:DegV family protein with EDD domain